MQMHKCRLVKLSGYCTLSLTQSVGTQIDFRDSTLQRTFIHIACSSISHSLNCAGFCTALVRRVEGRWAPCLCATIACMHAAVTEMQRIQLKFHRWASSPGGSWWWWEWTWTRWWGSVWTNRLKRLSQSPGISVCVCFWMRYSAVAVAAVTAAAVWLFDDILEFCACLSRFYGKFMRIALIALVGEPPVEGARRGRKRLLSYSLFLTNNIQQRHTTHSCLHSAVSLCVRIVSRHRLFRATAPRSCCCYSQSFSSSPNICSR